MRVVVNTRKLDDIIRKTPGRVEEIIGKLAMETEAYAKENMSKDSPSSPGEAPAVVTGNLKNSIIAKPEGKLRWVVNVGAPYGINLEYGTPTMAARPFLLPAVMAVVKDAPKKLVKVVED